MPVNMQWQTKGPLSFILIPVYAGVYELGALYLDRSIGTIYIGKAGGQNTLNGRVPQHFQDSEPNKDIKLYAQFFRYEINSNPDQREKELLEEFRVSHNGQLPICNTQMPK